jgi:hypothetical protein
VNNLTPFFSTVSSAYANNYAELELARNAFIDERRRIFNHLSAMLSAHGTPVVESEFYVCYYIPAARWTQTRSRDEKAGRAGYTFALGPLPFFDVGGVLAFAAYCFFQMGPLAFRKLPPPVTAEPGVHVEQSAGYARFCRHLIRASDPEWQLGSFEAAVKTLPDAFTQLDERLSIAEPALASPVLV